MAAEKYYKESESVSHSVMSNSVTPWTAALQAPLSMEFSRQEYWSGLPFPTPGNLPSPGTETASPESPALQVDFLPLSHLGRPSDMHIMYLKLN